MFNVQYLILSFFQLVLRVFFKLALEIIDKNLGIFKIFLEKSFKLQPYDLSNTFITIFLLGLLEIDNTIEK